MKYRVLNKTLDIWESENLTKEEATKVLIELENKQTKKVDNDWYYEYEIREIHT